MNDLLAWYNVIFYVPLLTGICFIAIAGMGGGDAGIDADADIDVDADADTDLEDSLVGRALSIFGIGKCPLSIVIMTSLMIFGGSGLILNRLILPFFSLIGAFIVTMVLTRIVATTIGKIMPSTETYTVGPEHIMGLSGTVVIRVTKDFGQIHVIDHLNTLHKLKCKTFPEAPSIPSGKKALVVDYQNGFYLVEEYKEG
jgi:hypothetical protein